MLLKRSLNWGFYWLALCVSLPILLPIILLVLAGIMGMVWQESSSSLFSGILFLAFLIIFPILYALTYGKIFFEISLLFKALVFTGVLGVMGGAILEWSLMTMKSWRLSHRSTWVKGSSLLFWGIFWTMSLMFLLASVRGYTFCDVLFNQRLCCEVIYNRDSCLLGKDIFASLFQNYVFFIGFLMASIGALPGILFYFKRKRTRKRLAK